MPATQFSDFPLSQRLEAAEGAANAGFVDARLRLDPGCGAAWIEVAGTRAMFDTPDSPVTQTFGLGLFSPVSAADLDQLEAFFEERGAPVHHEISPLADKSVWPLLTARGYEPFEFTNLLYLPLGAPEPAHESGIAVRIAKAAEDARWAALATEAWSADAPEMTAILAPLMHTVFHASGVVPFIAEKEGCPIATASLNIQNGVALLAGASTIPAGRKQGAQRALLAARLRHAVEQGCDLATMGAEPGSGSQRNAERSGFRIAYTRTKWRKPHGGAR